jgi:hypothetical protein
VDRLSKTLFFTCLITVGCAPEQPFSKYNSEAAIRMDSVVRIALDRATNPLHRNLIERGVVFVDLEDLEVPCVGLRVPMPDSDKEIFLAFTKEWFHENSDEAAADALISDLGRVLDDLENRPSSK